MGRRYLLEHNIPEQNIIPEEELSIYTPKGSYSGVTEVYRPARWYKDHPEAKLLIIITDEEQILRKQLHCLEMGVMCQIQPVVVSVDEARFHSLKGNVFGILATVLLPKTWQELYQRTVEERRQK